MRRRHGRAGGIRPVRSRQSLTGTSAVRRSGAGAHPCRGRDRFGAALSTDGAKTWPVSKLLEGDLQTEFHDPAIPFVGDAVLVAYSDNTTGGPHMGSLRVRRLTRDWLRR